MPRHEIADLREKRASAFEEMKRLNDKALEEARDFTAEEATEYERIERDFDGLTSTVNRSEKLEGLTPQIAKRDVHPDEVAEFDRKLAERQAENAEQAEIRPNATPQYERAFSQYLRQGVNLDVEQRAALQVGTDSEGGYTVAQEWHRQLVEAQREFGVVRQLATVITTTESGQLNIPTVATTGTAALTAEEAAFTESEDTFGTVALNAYKIGTLIKISDELLHDSIFDLNGFIQRRAGQAIGIKENNYFVVGTGSSQPNGLTVAASTGKTAAGTNAITTDELIDLFHSVLSPYRRNASWIMKDSTAQVIRKLKDTTNQYIWQPGLQAGAPDVLLGRPVFTDPDMPAVATGAESVVFGDISAYWIRDVEGATVKVLQELYAANGQVGYRVSRRTDGDLVDTTAVKCLSQA